MAEPLRLHGVGKRYGPRRPWVLRDVELELRPGSLTRVDGTNGSGKSTLLAVVAGIGRPTRGRVTGRGRTAYVPERLPSVLPFTVTGYLEGLGAVHGLEAGEARRRASGWLDRLGASSWAGAPVATLSKGTAQKVALAQALLADADLLVLDEAWTGLDPAARAVLDAAVNERVAGGVTVVFVDHHQAGRADPDVDVLVVTGSSVERTGPPGLPGRGRVTTSAPGDGTVEIEIEDDEGRRVLHSPPESSDDVLRAVLAHPGSHVLAVRTLAAPRLEAGAGPEAVAGPEGDGGVG